VQPDSHRWRSRTCPRSAGKACFLGFPNGFRSLIGKSRSVSVGMPKPPPLQILRRAGVCAIAQARDMIGRYPGAASPFLALVWTRALAALGAPGRMPANGRLALDDQGHARSGPVAASMALIGPAPSLLRRSRSSPACGPRRVIDAEPGIARCITADYWPAAIPHRTPFAIWKRRGPPILGSFSRKRCQITSEDR